MKVSGIQAYSEQSVQYLRDSAIKPQNGAAARQTSSLDTQTSSNAGESSSENIITRNEREFFMRLFPSSSEQLDKHVVFNRNGRLQVQNLTKGVIVDGKA